MTQADPSTIPSSIATGAAVAPDATTGTVPVAPLDTEPRPLPIWASLLIIILCLGGGFWIMRWYVSTDPLTHETKVLDPGSQPLTPFANRVQPRAAAAAAAAAANVPAVRKQDETSWWVHAPEAAMLVDTKSTPAAIKVINYTNYEFVPQEDRNRIINARRIARDDAVAKALSLNPEQLQTMRGLTQQIGMVTDPADQENMKKLWADYQAAANKGPAEQALTRALSELARKSVDRTRQAAADRAAKIKGVLTDDQWKQFEAMGR